MIFITFISKLIWKKVKLLHTDYQKINFPKKSKAKTNKYCIIIRNSIIVLQNVRNKPQAHSIIKSSVAFIQQLYLLSIHSPMEQ